MAEAERFALIMIDIPALLGVTAEDFDSGYGPVVIVPDEGVICVRARYTKEPMPRGVTMHSDPAIGPLE